MSVEAQRKAEALAREFGSRPRSVEPMLADAIAAALVEQSEESAAPLRARLAEVERVAAEGRAAGRAEAAAILMAQSAEEWGASGAPEDMIECSPIADTGDYGYSWNPEKVRQMFDVPANGGAAASLIERLDAGIWTAIGEHVDCAEKLSQSVARLAEVERERDEAVGKHRDAESRLRKQEEYRLASASPAPPRTGRPARPRQPRGGSAASMDERLDQKGDAMSDVLAVKLGCQAMDERLSKGPPLKPILRIEDLEETTGLLVAHGLLAPGTLRSQHASGINLVSYALYGVHFVDVNFSGCLFTSTDLRGASFVGCRFSDCDFSDADFAGVLVHGCRFSGCVFTGARWSGAEVTRTDVVECVGWPDAPDGYRNVTS